MRRLGAAIFAAAWLTAAAGQCADTFFRGLGDLHGQATAISGDGNVIVGRSGSEAFRWDETYGIDGMGDSSGEPTCDDCLPEPTCDYCLPKPTWLSSSAQGVSVAGEYIVGWGTQLAGTEAYRWSEADGMVGLGDLPGGRFESLATDVSGNGSVVVGRSISGPNGWSHEAFRWTAEEGMLGLGMLENHEFNSAAAVSDDGTVIVGTGYGFGSQGVTQGFRWTRPTGIIGLGNSPSGATAISADGSVIVGYATVDGITGPARWTSDSGYTLLRDTAGKVLDGAIVAVSSDGSVVVGQSLVDVVVWSQSTGAMLLRDMLGEARTEYDQWSEIRLTGMTDDGRMLVGWGKNSKGDQEAWIARIAPVPEPGSAALMLFGASAIILAGSNSRRRAKRASRAGLAGSGPVFCFNAVSNDEFVPLGGTAIFRP